MIDGKIPPSNFYWIVDLVEPERSKLYIHIIKYTKRRKI